MPRVIAFFLLILPSGGFSALQWLWRYTWRRSSSNEQDMARVAFAFGINSQLPSLVEAWARYEDARSYENRKNVMAEWAKLDAHRASFFLSLLILVLAVIAIAEAIAIVFVGAF